MLMPSHADCPADTSSPDYLKKHGKRKTVRENEMKKKRIMALLLCLGVVASGCGRIDQKASVQKTEHGFQGLEKQETSEDAPDVSAIAGGDAKEVLMVYMVGSNLESDSGLASADIEEMQQCGFDDDDLKVLICTGGTDSWWNPDIPDGECAIFELTEDGFDQVASLGDRDMADPQTLSGFVDFAYQSYSADDYSMVLWNHGGGAILGYGADENYGYDALSMRELDEALGSTDMAADGQKFEWIGFDACLMGMIEVADVLSDYSDYMIASEEMEAGDGWDYSFLRQMTDYGYYDGRDAASCVLDAYSSYYEDNYRYVPDYTLSCMDLTKTDAVKEKLDAFVLSAEQELKDGGYSKIAKIRDQAKSFGKVSEDTFYDTVDLYDLSDKMELLYPKESSDLKAAIDDCVVEQVSNVPMTHGMAIYFPYENKDYVDEWLDIYGDIGFSDNYIGFVRNFTATLSGDPITDWHVEDTAPEEDVTAPGEYYVQLREDQVENLGHADYQLWMEDDGYEGTYILWMLSSDVSLSDDDKLYTNFDGKRFFLNDAEGGSVACCALEIESGEDYKKYEIPLMLWRKDADLPENVYAHVRVDAEHPDGEVIGFYSEIDTDSTLFPQKNQVVLNEGDGVCPYLFAREIQFNEDGSVTPFSEWEPNSGTGAWITLSDDYDISMQEPDEVSNYCCLFRITDTQGNQYYTNPVYIEK